MWNLLSKSSNTLCRIKFGLLLLVTLISSSISTSSSSTGVWTSGPANLCSRSEQIEVAQTSEMLSCETLGPQDVVVRLTIPNNNYSGIIPSEVIVKRCVGGCSIRSNRHFSCLPTSTQIKEINVCMLPNSEEVRESVAQCAIAQLEEHTSCGCGCRVTASDCYNGTVDGFVGTPRRFVEEECKCECQNIQERIPCINQGNFWDDRTCACYCAPPHQWPTCNSGFVYDHTPGICMCVGFSTNAALVLELLVIVVVLGLLKITFGLIHCYRSRTGFFKPDRIEVHERPTAFFSQNSVESNTQVAFTNQNSINPEIERVPSRFHQIYRMKDILNDFLIRRQSAAVEPRTLLPTQEIPVTQETTPMLRTITTYAPLNTMDQSRGH